MSDPVLLPPELICMISHLLPLSRQWILSPRRYRWVNAEGTLIVFRGHDRSTAATVTRYFEEGSRQQRRTYKNGLSHGPSWRWHSNGNLYLSTNFRWGVPHGLHRVYHRDGGLVGEGRTVDGCLEGVVWSWWPNGGGPKKRTSYKHNIREGLSEEWDAKGNRVKEYFVNGLPHGPSRTYFPTGGLKRVTHYVYGVPRTGKSWYLSGALETKTSWPPWESRPTIYHYPDV